MYADAGLRQNPKTKELLMQKKTNQKTDLLTLSLVSIAQNAETKCLRDCAMLKLW